MITKESNDLILRFQLAQNNHSCPECGARMDEIDRASENGVSFIWYQCTRKDCNGQGLSKSQ